MKAQLTPEGKFALRLIVGVVGTFVVFLFFDQPELGLGTAESLACFLVAVRATWKRRGERWYWGAVVVAGALQIPFIVYVPWANRAFRGTALTLFGVVDFVVVWGVIQLGGVLFGRASQSGVG